MSIFSCKATILVLAIAAYCPASTIHDYFLDRGAGSVSYTIAGTNLAIDETIEGFYPDDNLSAPLTYYRTFVATSGSPGPTIYSVVNTIVNGTTVTWNNFTLTVGCNYIPAWNNTSIVDCYGPTHAQGRIVGTVTSSSGSVLQPNAGYFRVSGMSVAPGQSLELLYQYETCDGCGSSSFIYKYANTPTPEPSTLILLGSSLLGFSLLKHYRRSRDAGGAGPGPAPVPPGSVVS